MPAHFDVRGRLVGLVGQRDKQDSADRFAKSLRDFGNWQIFDKAEEKYIAPAPTTVVTALAMMSS